MAKTDLGPGVVRSSKGELVDFNILKLKEELTTNVVVERERKTTTRRRISTKMAAKSAQPKAADAGEVAEPIVEIAEAETPEVTEQPEQPPRKRIVRKST